MKLLKKLKRDYKKWVQIFLNKIKGIKFPKFKFKKKKSFSSNSSVKLGSSLKHIPRQEKIDKYINDVLYNFKLRRVAFLANYQVKDKTLILLSHAFNVCLTGFLIQYTIENRNFISYGLAIYLGLYYLEKVIKMIKTPYKNKLVEEDIE